MANRQKRQISDGKIRIATKEDTPLISRLLQHPAYAHWHADWRLPVDWIGQSGFVLLPSGAGQSLNPFQFESNSRLLGCLAVAADPLPAAWVRVVGLAGGVRPFLALGAMLDHVTANLTDTAVTEINWLATQPWPNDYLPMLGFEISNHIETYQKSGMALPPTKSIPGLTIRPADDDDLAVLEKIEAEAFVPKWRYSAGALALARRQAVSFEVAMMGEEIVGYQLSAPAHDGVHLVRLALRPSWHGRGIGSAFLAHTITGYHSLGVTQATLNTQIDNKPSQILYRKFGFAPTGEKFPVWTKHL